MTLSGMYKTCSSLEKLFQTERIILCTINEICGWSKEESNRNTKIPIWDHPQCMFMV